VLQRTVVQKLIQGDEPSLFDDEKLLISISVVCIVIAIFVACMGCFYFHNMVNRRAHSVLAIKELGLVNTKKKEEEEANLSICLDIGDSDAGDSPTSARRPMIAGTFMEEDITMFESAVFS
jgi:hypothetical protein